jgi:hypothetical protein
MAYEHDHAKAAAFGSFAATIAAVAAWLNSRKVAGGDFVLPPEVIQLLIAWAATTDDIKALVTDILNATSGGGGGAGWPPNADSITSLRVAITPATGVQLPSIVIPSGMAVVIKAYALNPAWLWVGASEAECGQVNQAFPLLPNETVSYQIEDANQVYIAAMTPGGVATAGCFACVTVEQRRGGG